MHDVYIKYKKRVSALTNVHNYHCLIQFNLILNKTKQQQREGKNENKMNKLM